MPKASVEKGNAYFFEEGVFLAILRSVEEKSVDFTYLSRHKAVQRGTAKVGETGTIHRWVWSWELLEGDRVGSQITVETNPSIELEGYSPARVAYEALLGEPVELGQDVDTDLVVGMRARLVLMHATPRQVDERTFYDTKVSDVMPAGDVDPWATSDEPPF